MGRHLRRAEHRPQTHSALPAPDQRQDRTLPPHPRRRVGVQTVLRLRNSPPPSPPSLDPRIQSPQTPHRDRQGRTHHPLNQPARALHLASRPERHPYLSPWRRRDLVQHGDLAGSVVAPVADGAAGDVPLPLLDLGFTRPKASDTTDPSAYRLPRARHSVVGALLACTAASTTRHPSSTSSSTTVRTSPAAVAAGRTRPPLNPVRFTPTGPTRVNAAVSPPS
jgi:hypothetical protein